MTALPGTVQRRARLAGGGLMSVIAALLALQAVWIGRHCEELRPMAPGDMAPQVTLARADGRGQGDLASLRGQVVLVDFWATWCAPCRETMPIIERLHRRYQDRGLVVFSINTDGGPGAAGQALAFARQGGLTFPIFLDDGVAGARYGVSSIPRMFLIDRQGRIRKVHGTALSMSALERDLGRSIEQLLAEPATAP